MKNDKKIALSIEQMKHLEELGLDTDDASMARYANVFDEDDDDANPDDYDTDFMIDEDGDCPAVEDSICTLFLGNAYTLEDILLKLPKTIDVDYRHYVLYIEFDYNTIMYVGVCDGNTCRREGDVLHEEVAESCTLIDTAYEMLCWCIENKHIKIKEEDE